MPQNAHNSSGYDEWSGDTWGASRSKSNKGYPAWSDSWWHYSGSGKSGKEGGKSGKGAKKGSHTTSHWSDDGWEDWERPSHSSGDEYGWAGMSVKASKSSSPDPWGGNAWGMSYGTEIHEHGSSKSNKGHINGTDTSWGAPSNWHGKEWHDQSHSESGKGDSFTSHWNGSIDHKKPKVYKQSPGEASIYSKSAKSIDMKGLSLVAPADEMISKVSASPEYATATKPKATKMETSQKADDNPTHTISGKGSKGSNGSKETTQGSFSYAPARSEKASKSSGSFSYGPPSKSAKGSLSYPESKSKKIESKSEKSEGVSYGVGTNNAIAADDARESTDAIIGTNNRKEAPIS